MNFAQKLSSKNLLVFNLVLVGVIFGFSLAFLSFSCSTPGTQRTVLAEETPVSIPEDALAIAEGLQTAFRSLAAKVLPSVVEIKTVSVRRQQVPNYPGIPWEFFFGPQEGNPNSQEREYRSQAVGSGIIVRHDQDTYYVLTNNHVVEDATEISLVSWNGTEYKAELVGTDERKDLAMVSFKTDDGLPVAVLGDSDAVQVGDWAIAVGTPLGFMSSVTRGIVSAVGRTGGPAGNINDFIQTDASINQGNSGGALVNIRGEVIGINTWIASNNSGGSVGLGFAIPINNAKRVIDDFISSGSASYGWLGVSLTDMDREFLQALSAEGKYGAFASQVFIDSPADKGGIKPGDFITHVDNKEVRDSTALTRMVGDLRAGEQAVFTVIRGGQTQNIQVRIEKRTDEVAANNKNLWPGLIPFPVNDEIRSAYNLDKNTQGLVAIQVIAGSPADVIGLRRGDLITAINGEQVRNLQEFYRLLQDNTSRELWFSFNRGASSLETLKFKR
ncbi:MAG: Do family serine endopeptidase [Treponema sp.]|nr:Do family serine endopeptidase [Treponema sp.]